MNSKYPGRSKSKRINLGPSQIQVPEKTIAVFSTDVEVNQEVIDNLLMVDDTKRPWFSKHFYHCLPLSIANQYGFTFKTEFGFSAVWNGDDSKEGLRITKHETTNNRKFTLVESHFGHGIFTVNVPFSFRTSSEVSIMVIPPINYLLPNLTVLCGVIETDNLRRDFTLNFRLELPNVAIEIPAGTPLATLLPIPRYFADSFKLELAENLFSQDTLDAEYQTMADTYFKRKYEEPYTDAGIGRDYFRGQDVYGNKFKDHQLPKRGKNKENE